ncbi:hypothetical protein GCM10007161_06130 [Ignatzschineria indica]|uniref:Uncharacterized protein n=1 Tax=Ignatzschineria indica TaxID=472583 RepID=A0A2U2AN67_9GAMM|nr:hypothetical protein [Ignatzschineria indica]PWD84587.1 hypothetical protein DC082_03380 [Ignatzschineria indica]GGZ77681.1 hypothetical protein GCM10007161_06130 [Ignatzschineria indica]
MRVKAKLRKLWRNPRQFFIDSKIGKYFLKKEIPSFADSYDSLELNSDFRYQSLSFTTNGNVILPEERFEGRYLRTLFLFNEKYSKQMSNIVRYCYLQTDFKPLREDELMLFSYDDSIGLNNYFDLLLKIDSKNKERLSSYLNIFVFDENLNFAVALRQCNPDVCVTFVQLGGKCTDKSKVRIDPEYRLIDYVIERIPETLDTYNKNDRNTFYAQHFKEIGLFIRKIIQNQIPRERDIFLPIISDCTYKPDLIIKSDQDLDVIIKLKDMPIEKVKDHKELCIKIAEYVLELYVKESTYLKYQNLLEDVSLINIKKFLFLSTEDGLKFEVING